MADDKTTETKPVETKAPETTTTTEATAKPAAAKPATSATSTDRPVSARPATSRPSSPRPGGGRPGGSRPGGSRPPFRGRPGGGRDGRRGGFFRKKGCRFCKNSDIVINYKDARALRPFLTEKAKIMPRRITGNCAKHQRVVNMAIKRARNVAILPYTTISL